MTTRYFVIFMVFSIALALFSVACIYVDTKLEPMEEKSQEIVDKINTLIDGRLKNGGTLSNEQLISIFSLARNDQRSTTVLISGFRRVWSSLGLYLGMFSILQMLLITTMYIKGKKT